MKRRLISLLLSGTLVLTGAQSVFAASGEELVFTEAEESEEEACKGTGRIWRRQSS